MRTRRTSLLTRALLGLVVLLALVGVILLVLEWGAPEPSGSFGPRGLALAIGVPTVVLGTLVASRQPGNPIGWLLCGVGLTLSLTELTILYAIYALFVRGGSLPGGVVAAWLGGWTWMPMMMLLGLVFLLFPHGRLLSRRWRVVADALVASWLLVVPAVAFLPGPVDTFREVTNPFGASWAEPLGLLALPIALLALALAAGSLAPRYRRAGAEERAQVRWVAAAGLLLGVAFVTNVLMTVPLGEAPPVDPTVVDLSEAVLILAVTSVPVAVGIAILRYRLYDIDVVINKTVVFGVLAVFITAVYVAVVVGVGALVGSSGNALLSAIAAALVALAFQPVRRWAQRLANRLVYGQRATPYEVLSEFSGRVAGSYDTEDVLPRMATVLGEGTGARRAQVWLRLGTDLRPAAVWPEGAARSAPRAAASAELPDLPDVSHAVPVLDRGELLGALSVTKGASDPITPTEQKLARDLSLQAGLVLRNVRLVEELRASRERLVAAQDDERRKIERDLHDGAQQQLVALAVKARLAEAMVGEDDERERALLQELARETQETLESLRDLARGIYPPLLAEQGLVAALEAQSGKAAVPVVVRANGPGRYSREIEATVYFCVLEALQNAAKYADASEVEVVLETLDGVLRFEVTDDGRGFDPDLTPRGTGLQNMIDRLEAVGGGLEIRAEPAAGTSIAGRIPVR